VEQELLPRAALDAVVPAAAVPRHGVEVGVQALLPFLLVVALLATLGRSLVDGPQVLVRYAVVVAVMAVLHCLFALVRTRDPRFLLFVAYGFLHADCSCPCASGRC
jgi:hypothetical protein